MKVQIRMIRRLSAALAFAAVGAVVSGCGSSSANATQTPAPEPGVTSEAPALPSPSSPDTPTTPQLGPTGPTPTLPGSGVIEREGSRGAPTFTNPLQPNVPGPKVPSWAFVRVTCRTMTTETAIFTAFPDGWVYLIATSPWDDKYYAVANTFWNGDIPGHTPYTHNTDLSVPVCPQ